MFLIFCCLLGTTRDHFVKIAYKNHKHSTNNPYSQVRALQKVLASMDDSYDCVFCVQFRDEYTESQIASSPVVHEPLTKLQVSHTSPLHS